MQMLAFLQQLLLSSVHISEPSYLIFPPGKSFLIFFLLCFYMRLEKRCSCGSMKDQYCVAVVKLTLFCPLGTISVLPYHPHI